MKNKHLVPAICLLSSFVWLGCNKAGKLNQQSEFKPPSGPITLALKWPLGERIEQDMNMTLSNHITIPGRPPMTQNMTMGQNYGLTVLQANADGTHEIEMDFLSARMNMKMGSKTLMDYDSDKKSDNGSGATPNPLGDVFSKIIGSKIQYYLDASNAVDRVEGVNDLINKLSAGGSAQAVAPIKSMFSEGYFKQMMSANQFLPSKPVVPGDTWPVQIEVPLGQLGTMIMHYDFTFSNWEEHGKRYCARLDFQGTVESKPDDNTKNGMTMTVQNGTTSGTAWFDPELGITIDTIMNQDMTMAMQLPTQRGGAPQTLSNQMNQALEIKLVSVK